jgi:peptidoglycan/xylan/chitin deacetylase (PgdA/CDA1 family)
VYEYWLNGTPLPAHPIVVSFDDGHLSQDTQAMPVLHKLHWAGVLNLKVNAVKSPYTLPAWHVRDMLAAVWELDAHTITHPDLTHVDDAQLWYEVHGSRVELHHMFHVPVDFFCYPLARPQDIYTLSRIRINGSDHVLGFGQKLESLPR